MIVEIDNKNHKKTLIEAKNNKKINKNIDKKKQYVNKKRPINSVLNTLLTNSERMLHKEIKDIKYTPKKKFISSRQYEDFPPPSPPMTTPNVNYQTNLSPEFDRGEKTTYSSNGRRIEVKEDLRPTILPILSPSSSKKNLSRMNSTNTNYLNSIIDDEKNDLVHPNENIQSDQQKLYLKSARSATSNTSAFSSLPNPTIFFDHDLEINQDAIGEEGLSTENINITTNPQSPFHITPPPLSSLSGLSSIPTTPVQVNVFIPQLLFDDESIASLENLSIANDPLLSNRQVINHNRPNFPSLNQNDKLTTNIYSTNKKIVNLNTLSSNNSPRIKKNFNYSPSSPPSQTIKDRLPFLNFDYSSNHVVPKI